MSIRVKLLLTYVLLLVISLMFLLFYGVAAIGGMLRFASEAVFEADPQVVIEETIDTITEMKSTFQTNPTRLTEDSFIKEMTDRTGFYKGGLVVLVGDQYINYSELPKDPEFYRMLHKDNRSWEEKLGEDRNPDTVGVRYQGVDYAYLDFSFQTEGQEVTYFFIADFSSFDAVQAKGGEIVLSFLLILLLLITLPLLLIIHYDILKPIRTLETGVQHIGEGDLDFVLESKKKNELGRVIASFDQMREKLKASIDAQVEYENNRKEFISSISHDLKTPITSIQGYVAGILDGVADTPEKEQKYLEVIAEKAKQMNLLIDDLFTLSKLDVNRIHLSLQPVLLGRFLEEFVEEEKVDLAENIQIQLETEPDAFDQTVHLDEFHMKRVLANIIQNSKKYTDKPETRIRIRAKMADAQTVLIQIEDNGKGIRPEELPHLFDRFYRADPSRSSAQGGSGLGLAIAKQIVDAHGGTISATAIVGEGTTLKILLSCDVPEEGKEDTV